MTERMLTPGEVGRILRVHPRTVTRWAKTGHIAAIRTPGGHTRVPQSAVDALLYGDSQ